jgi:ArsR family transcriptional regulator, arsenate/arsenite/antimonite-responsive transcriptional repressor
MEKVDVVDKLSALAQPARLEMFLAIAKSGDGLTSTQVAEATGTMPNNTSVHLAVLRNAGLVTSVKEGRTVTYRAIKETVRSLATFLGKAAE